jgi:putative oxidoreductase
MRATGKRLKLRLLLSWSQSMNRQQVVTVAKEAAKWIPALLLVLIFVPQGWSKFSDTSGWAAAFRHWGYPIWFRIAIGVIEVVAAALLLWRRTAPVGAALIVIVMLGGMATHLAFDNGRHMTSEVVPLTLAVSVLWLRKDYLRKVAPIGMPLRQAVSR